MQTNPAVEQSKIVRWSASPCNLSGEKGKRFNYGGKNSLKSQVLSSEWNTERVREDASGNSEDSEDDVSSLSFRNALFVYTYSYINLSTNLSNGFAAIIAFCMHHVSYVCVSIAADVDDEW